MEHGISTSQLSEKVDESKINVLAMKQRNPISKIGISEHR
jgi:hypothetical protein